TRAAGRRAGAEHPRLGRGGEGTDALPRPLSALSYERPVAGEQVLQGLGVDRLGQVVVDPRRERAAAVVLLAVAGQRYQQRLVEVLLAGEVAEKLLSSRKVEFPNPHDPLPGRLRANPPPLEPERNLVDRGRYLIVVAVKVVPREVRHKSVVGFLIRYEDHEL